MALVSAGFKLSVVLVDSGNDTSTKTYDLQSTTAAEATTDAATILTALNAITSATVRSYTIGEKFEEDAFVFPALVEIENQAEIVARLSTLNKTATLYIPAPIPAIFVAANGDGFNIVDGTATEVANYLALFNSGAQAYLSDGEFVTATVAQRFKSGKRIHKGSRNG